MIGDRPKGSRIHGHFPCNTLVSIATCIGPQVPSPTRARSCDQWVVPWALKTASEAIRLLVWKLGCVTNQELAEKTRGRRRSSVEPEWAWNKPPASSSGRLQAAYSLCLLEAAGLVGGNGSRQLLLQFCETSQSHTHRY